MDNSNNNNNELHIIFMNDILSKDVKMLNNKIKQYLIDETKLNKDRISNNIHIRPYYDQIINTQKQCDDIKIMDIENTFISIEPYTDFTDHDLDGYLWIYFTFK